MYYAHIKNEQLISITGGKYLDKGVINIQVTEELYKDWEKHPNKYQPNETLDGIELNPNYEEIKAQEERERLDNLSLTKADVERAIYADKGMDFDDLIEYVKANVPTMDIKALKIELGAKDFYRKHPYINQLGQLLGYTSDDLDYLFENKVLPVKE